MRCTYKLRVFIPFVISISLLSLLGYELYYPTSQILASTLIGKTMPSFSIPNLLTPQLSFTDQELKGRYSLLNIWATWCYACQLEHPMLMRISHDNHIPIYSINYKDNPEEARAWL